MTRRLSRRGRKQAMCAGVSVALAVLAGAAWSGPAGAATAKPDAVAGVRLSAGPLGIDVAPWTNPATLTALRSQLEAAHVTQIHYGGGTTADEYNWETDTDISNCNTMSAADYSAASARRTTWTRSSSPRSPQEARAIGAQSMVTVNFGTGQAAWAADLGQAGDDHAQPGHRRLRDRQRELRVLGTQRLHSRLPAERRRRLPDEQRTSTPACRNWRPPTPPTPRRSWPR